MLGIVVGLDGFCAVFGGSCVGFGLGLNEIEVGMGV